MSSSLLRRASKLQIQLLRLQYWYDRLSELQRLGVGLFAIVVLATSWLYVLGFGSTILLLQVQELGEPRVLSGEVPTPVVVVVEATARPNETPVPTRTATPTPEVETSGELIEPPDVPEVAILSAPPREVVPVQPLKPRVVAATSTPPKVTTSPVATAAPTRAGQAPAGSPAPLGTPTPAAKPQTQVAPTPARGNAPTATATPIRRSAPTSTRASVNTPGVPPVATTAPRAAAPTATPRRR